MPEQPHEPDHLIPLLHAVERRLAESPNDVTPTFTAEVRVTLARIKSETPGGAPLHAQLDNVRKWLDALDRPADHERFGGAAHLRDYVLTQLRLALGALEDYRREMQ